MGNAMNGSDAEIALSPMAALNYGFTKCRAGAIESFGKALLVVSGADGVISDGEYRWFYDNFAEMLQLPDDMVARLKVYDPNGASLSELISDIHFDSGGHLGRMLLFDAIRMAQADERYPEAEKSAVAEMAGLLGLNDADCEEIGSLIRIEASIRDFRKAIFQVREDHQYPIPPDGPDLVKYNAWVTYHFGHAYTTRDAMEAFFHLLLTIAAADGEISESELQGIEDLAVSAGVPEDVRNTLRDYEIGSERMEDLISRISIDADLNVAAIAIYLAIRIASADQYDTAEQAAVRDAAKRLSVDITLVPTIEMLVFLEAQFDQLRRAQFGLDV